MGHQEEDQITEVQLVGTETLEAINRAEIDVQISTARAYPRNIVASKKKATDLATMDRDIAESCMYALKRGNKTIIGPSVRLAEIVVSSWGNIRAASRITGNDGRVITAEAICHDLESNVAIKMEVRRSIKDSKGRTYSDDMQVVAGNAASAIALRNAVFKVIPGVFTKSIFEAAQKVAVGGAMELTQRRTNAIAWFAKFNITEEQVLTLLERKTIEEITSEDLVILLGIKSSVTNGESTIADHFYPNLGANAGAASADEVMLGRKAEQEGSEVDNVLCKKATTLELPSGKITIKKGERLYPAEDGSGHMQYFEHHVPLEVINAQAENFEIAYKQ